MFSVVAEILPWLSGWMGERSVGEAGLHKRPAKENVSQYRDFGRPQVNW